MEIALQTAGQLFLEQVLEAYRHSPEQIAIFVAAVGIPLIFLITYAILQRRRDIEAWTRESRGYFINDAERLKLTPSQRQAMYRIGELATRPWKQHEVFTEESTFNRGAWRLLEKNEVAQDTISSLRLKLGYTRHGGVPISSVGLPVDSRVAVAREGNPTVVGAVVTAQKPGAMIVTLDEEWKPIREGVRVRVLYRSKSGVYSFLTTVLARKGTKVALRHSEQLGRSQRRRYYRRAIRIPAEFALKTWEDFEPTVTRDLGGGGASIELPGNTSVSTGEKVWLRFNQFAPKEPAGEGPRKREPNPRFTTAICTVVRTSEEGRVAHLDFTAIHDRLRDRIIERLFSDARSRSSESAPAR